MNRLQDLAVGMEKNVINYDKSEEASGLIPPTRQPYPYDMASSMVSGGAPGAGPAVRPGVSPDLSGMTTVRSVSGSKVSSMLIETANVRGRMNPVVQFTIVNSGVGATAQKLRIGSVANAPDAFSLFGIVAGASDNAVIVDQFGAGCLKVQGYSLLVSHKPMVVNEIHLISSSLSQLNTEFFHKLIHPDAVIDDRSNNIAFTQQKTDQKETLNVAKGKWLLDSNQFLEFTMLAGADMTILLHHIAIANVSTFTPVS